MVAPRPVPKLAPALFTLRRQVDERFPDRPKHLDGWIGDAQHAARVSDHNPDHRGLVHAIDITDGFSDHCPELICSDLLHALLRNRDPRLRYMIHDGRIWAGHAGPQPWQPRKYHGANQHRDHLHVSVLRDTLFSCDARLWKL